MLDRRIASAVLAAVALTAAPAGAAADESADVRAAATVLGISEAQAADRLELQPYIGALRADARRLWPGTFAGMWTNHAAGGVVTIAFTESPQERVAQLAQGFPRPLLLRAVGAEHSAAALDRALSALADDRDEIRAGRMSLPGLDSPRFNVTVDEPRNRVVMTVERASRALRAAIAARHGDVVVVEEGDVGEAGCSRDNCTASMRSGLRTNLGFSGGWCSTAFTTSNRTTFSAGHCGEVDRHHGGWRYGSVFREQVSGRVDAELHGVSSSGFAARGWIFDEGVNAARAVTSRGAYSQMAIGDVVCKTGATTGRSCGRVDALNTSPHWVPSSSHFVRATNMCSRGGDSGSGVYIGGQAVGILSGVETDQNCSAGTNPTWFGHIEFAQNALNENVRTSEGAPSFSSFRAVGGQYELTVEFSLPVSCGTVQPSDFTVKIAGAIAVSVTGETCSDDSDGSFQLKTSTPLVSSDYLEVALVGTVTDPGGNTVPKASRGGYVE